MLRHIVLLTFADGTSPDVVGRIVDALRELPDQIPELRSYVVGTDLALADGNADVAVVADLDDESGYVTYSDHPAHRRVIEDLISPVLASRVAVQHSR